MFWSGYDAAWVYVDPFHARITIGRCSVFCVCQCIAMRLFLCNTTTLPSHLVAKTCKTTHKIHCIQSELSLELPFCISIKSSLKWQFKSEGLEMTTSDNLNVENASAPGGPLTPLICYSIIFRLLTSSYFFVLNFINFQSGLIPASLKVWVGFLVQMIPLLNLTVPF